MIRSLFVVAAIVAAPPAVAQTAPMTTAAPTAAAPERPFCSATITDGCQQTKAQQARAMTGAQVDARDARNGGQWTPDMKVTTTTTGKTKKGAAN